MINIETKEDRLLYIDSVTAFDRLREQQLYDMFRRMLNNSDDISEVWLPELSKRDVCIGITIRELNKVIKNEKNAQYRISMFTDYDNGPILNDYLIDEDNFVPCIIDLLKEIIEDIDFRTPTTARDWKKKEIKCTDDVSLSEVIDVQAKMENNIMNENIRQELVKQGIDIVNHPGHYETGKFECIEVMQEDLGVDAVKDFCICNAFKYLYRYKRKNGLEDIKKAKWYIDKYLDLCSDNEEGIKAVGDMIEKLGDKDGKEKEK